VSIAAQSRGLTECSQKWPNILAACRSDSFFARWFRNPESWRAWHTFLKVQFGLPMDEADLALYRRCLGAAWTTLK
jgi:hypothetical protein